MNIKFPENKISFTSSPLGCIVYYFFNYEVINNKCCNKKEYSRKETSVKKKIIFEANERKKKKRAISFINFRHSCDIKLYYTLNIIPFH